MNSASVIVGGIVPTGAAATLWVCEGPALIEHVATLGLNVPMLCFSGVPMQAHHDIVKAFAGDGWQVAVSADHEPRALIGAAALLATAGDCGLPWRLDLSSHLAGKADEHRRLPESARVPDTPWDSRLAEGIRADRRRVTEEGKIELLLADFPASPRGA